MIVQIEDLFIETDNIVTLSPYSIERTLKAPDIDKEESETNATLINNEDKLVAHGITINGLRYGLFTTKADEESVKKGKTVISSVIATLINTKVHPVQRLNLNAALENETENSTTTNTTNVPSSEENR